MLPCYAIYRSFLDLQPDLDLRCMTVINRAKRFMRRIISIKRLARVRCRILKTNLRRRLSIAFSYFPFAFSPSLDSPAALTPLPAGRLPVHEISRYLEATRRGLTPLEVCERSLLAWRPFLPAPAGRPQSSFHLQPDLDKPANVPQPEANAIENTRKAREGLLVNFRLSGFRSYCPA